MNTIYPPALVIISLSSLTFHCMFTWLQLLRCTSCAGGTKSKIDSTIKRQLSGNSSLTLQTAAFWTGPAMHCPFTSEISVKREHGILIPVMHYFYFLYVRDPCVGPPLYPPLPCFSNNFSKHEYIFLEIIGINPVTHFTLWLGSFKISVNMIIV